MTDDEKHESRVNVMVDGECVASFVLPDDPADSRGVLSWHYQPAANRLDEAGSYGYLCKVNVPGRLAATSWTEAADSAWSFGRTKADSRCTGATPGVIRSTCWSVAADGHP